MNWTLPREPSLIDCAEERAASLMVTRGRSMARGVLVTIVGLIILGAALLAGSLLSGCGAAALSAQTTAVEIGGVVWQEADNTVVRMRARELEAIVAEAEAECGADGCSDERAAEYRELYDAVEARWAPVMACREPVPESLRAWLDGLETARRAQDDTVKARWLASLASRVVLEYAALRGCVESANPEAAERLPDLPSTVTAIAEGYAE